MSGRLHDLWLGTVTDNDDPEGQGRVRVTYTGFAQGLEGDWAPVAVPYAGPDHGLFSIPEVGDMVVVAFMAGNVNQPVVLGSIWTGDGAPPGDRPTEKVWKSAKGHALTLSDETLDAILLEDRHGNRILMDKEGITIESAKALTVKAPSTALIDISGEATVKGNPIQLNP